ncbi:MAG: hypothetical protein IT329_09845 [Caldilineaceae bacterium]|nr:hypothetical protein [Caldilineaceae bacterium]
MRITTPLRRRAAFWLPAALLLTQFLGMALTPQTAQAAVSAEPSEEIVYIGEDGVIRIWDLEGNPAIEGSPKLDWSSPSGGWQYAALGDFNNDTDLEIAALRADGDNFVWTVFDPVVARGATNPDRKTPNGFPWDIYYEAPAERGIPKRIITGNFDDGIRGDEIAILWQDANGRSYVRIMKAASLGPDGNPTGRNWQIHIEKSFDQRYGFGVAGQMTEGGADELILLDKDSARSRMDIFRVDADFATLEAKSSTSAELREVAVGQIIIGGKEEIALIRSTPNSTTEKTLIIYEMREEAGAPILYDDDKWSWAFAPKPETVFLADITGNGDQEVWFLRKNTGSGARLIMRDVWGNDRKLFEDNPIEKSLDNGGEDNGFVAGTGGDVDGDGKDEVIIMRDNRIRIYTRPDTSMGNDTIVELPTKTNRETVLAGDLDAAAFIEGPSFGVTPIKIEAAVPTGTVSGNYALRVENISTPDPVTFNVFPEAGKPWIKVNPTIATTPANINVSFDATNLKVGVYTASITLSSGNMLNSPFTVAVELTVQPATIQTRPNAIAYLNFNCSDVASQDPLAMTLRVGGTAGLNYRAALIGIPAETAAAGLENAPTLADAGITGGEINSAGDIVLYDAQGRTRTLPTGIPAGLASGGDVSASAVLSTAWPIDPAVNWITSASSDKTSVPSDIQIVIDPSVLGNNYKLAQAALVLVGDTRAGTPPDNVFVVPVFTMCVSDRALLPVIQSAVSQSAD